MLGLPFFIGGVAFFDMGYTLNIGSTKKGIFCSRIAIATGKKPSK